MKIGNSEVLKGVYIVAEERIKNELEKDGFIVTFGDENDKFDIYAEKGDDKRIYELKIGKNKIQKKVLLRLQEIAKSKRARLFITYLEPPRARQIIYDGLENLLLDYLSNNFPSELDALSTHTVIEELSDVDIDSIQLSDDSIKVEGSAVIFVELSYGSTKDREDENGYEDHDSFDFSFKVKIVNSEIVHAYFKFDLEHFYE